MTEMFNNYQHIDPTYIPNNRPGTGITLVPTVSFPFDPTNMIFTSGKVDTYRCVPGEELKFEFEGKVYDDQGQEMDIDEYLSARFIAFKMYNVWSDIIYDQVVSGAKTTTISVGTNVLPGIYSCTLDLLKPIPGGYEKEQRILDSSHFNVEVI